MPQVVTHQFLARRRHFDSGQRATATNAWIHVTVTSDGLEPGCGLAANAQPANADAKKDVDLQEALQILHVRKLRLRAD